METVVVKTFDNYFSANIILSRLQASGIECYLMDEFTVTLNPILTNAIAGIKLVVKKENAAAVSKLLQAYQLEYLLSATCPQCGSNCFTHLAKPGVKNYVTALLTWLFSSYAVATDYVYQCGNCGYEAEDLPETVVEVENEN